MRSYAPISKMESQTDGTIKVWGVASSECVDNDGETITAAAMKEALPGYMEWGAVREMHSNIAAGRALEVGVNDDTGQTLICAHIVDTGSIAKVKAGVLKGFSIGGVATKTDPLNKTIITGLTLNEISLVDKPANPEAAISLWKADKMNAPISTTPGQEVTGEQLGNEIESLVKSGNMTIGDLMQLVKGAAAAKGMCTHKVTKGDKCDMCEGGIAKGAEIGELVKRYFTEEQRHDAATAGQAMPDGSFPIENEEDLKNAIKAYGRAKDPAAAKKHIEQRAKELGKEDLLPEDWEKVAKAAGGGIDGNELGKGQESQAGSAPAGAPLGEGSTAKAAASGAATAGDGTTATEEAALGAAGVNKAANAETPAVGMGTKGPDNAEVASGNPGTIPGGTVPNADTPMLMKPALGHLVTIKFGEDEVAGEIVEIEEGGAFKIKNGEAWLTADVGVLVHHEFIGEKVNWTVTEEDNAAFVAAKAAAAAPKGAAALMKFATGGAGKPIKKGMYTVSDWSDLLQRIVWLYKDIQWEGDAEEDPKDREIANKIAAWLKAGADVWLEYAKDELQEMLTGVADPDNVEAFIIELASKPGELQKFAEGNVGHVLQKALGGQLDAAALSATIQKAVKVAVATETATIQKAHAAEIAGLHEQLKALADTPAPVKGVTKSFTVNKDSNHGGAEESEVAPVIKSDGKVDDAATAIKKSFMQPQAFNRLSTQ